MLELYTHINQSSVEILPSAVRLIGFGPRKKLYVGWLDARLPDPQGVPQKKLKGNFVHG